MSGHEDMRGRRWSSRQRLVVLDFDSPESAERFDASLVTPRQIVELMWACRDVIDAWDDYEDDGASVNHAVEALRRLLYATRTEATQ